MRLEMALRSEDPDRTQFGRMLLRFHITPSEFKSFAKEAIRAISDPRCPEDVLAVWRRHFPDREAQEMLLLGMSYYTKVSSPVGLAMMQEAIPLILKRP